MTIRQPSLYVCTAILLHLSLFCDVKCKHIIAGGEPVLSGKLTQVHGCYVYVSPYDKPLRFFKRTPEVQIQVLITQYLCFIYL